MTDHQKVVFIDGVGAGRSSIESCRDGVQWIMVGDRVYWPLSDADAQRLHSACCGNGSFDGPSPPAGDCVPKIDTVCDALCSLDVVDEGCGGVCCDDPCDKSPQAAAAHWNRRAVAARDAEIERLQAEVDRLTRFLNRIVDWDGDSTLTIRAGADAFAAAKEFLQMSTPVAVDRASETRALRLADEAAESLVCTVGHSPRERQWVLYPEQIAADPYLEDAIAHLEWRGMATVERGSDGVTVEMRR